MSDAEGNAGWAESMAKILAMSKNVKQKNKPLILSKAKKDLSVPQKEPKGKIVKKNKELSKWENLHRVKPISQDKDYERQLIKIATRGTVQLFNAVTAHKKERGNERD